MSIKKFHAAPNEEVFGPALTALFNNIRAEEIRPILERHRITEADLKNWFPLQKLLDVYEDMLNRENMLQDFVALGVKTIDSIPYPPETNTVEKALQALEGSYYTTHRNHRPDEGTKVIFNGSSQAVVIFNAPYPDDIMYGYVWGTMRRFLPPGAKFIVSYVEPEEVGVTDPGTVMLVEW